MNDTGWINPVVKGSCDPFGGCGGGCCKIRVYNEDNTDYTLQWCEHFDEPTRRCKIYETRPEGCRKYPQVNTFLKERWLIPGCGYHLEEADPISIKDSPPAV
jgi:Fe-S-cluster containining protein